MSPRISILFDFDGTLVDTVDDIAIHANLALEEMGFARRSRREVMGAVGKGVHELFKSLAAPLESDPPALERIVASFKRRYAERPVIDSRAFPCVKESLEGFLRGIPKAIVTNKPADLTRAILLRLGLSEHFPVLVGLGDFEPKPDPAGALHALALLGGAPERSVLIGDSRVDRETARNAGVGFLWADYGYDDLSAEPVERVSSPCDWGRALSKRGSAVL